MDGAKHHTHPALADLLLQRVRTDSIAGADLVVNTFTPDAFDAEALAARHPSLVVLSITPWGRTGPYSKRPVTEFILQAESGSLSQRGLPSQPPVMAGGRITEWVGGTFAAVAALAACRHARDTGRGDHIDFSKEPLQNLAKDGQLMAYKHDDFWQCMDTIRDKKLLDELWETKPPWRVWE